MYTKLPVSPRIISIGFINQCKRQSFTAQCAKKPASIITYSYYVKLVVVQRNMNKYKTKQRLSLKETQLYKFSKSVNLVHHSLNVISR